MTKEKDIFEALRKDKQYYYVWQSNIAMAFYDEALRQHSRDSHHRIHTIANQAARNFLDLLKKPIKTRSSIRP